MLKIPHKIRLFQWHLTMEDTIYAIVVTILYQEFKVNVTAIFIDIVDSSKLTDGNKRPTLAKMYRAFLSECVAIMNSWEMCKEININGDCVWGVFETPKKSDVDNVISVAAQLNSMIKILNYKLKKKKYDTIQCYELRDQNRTKKKYYIIGMATFGFRYKILHGYCCL